MMEGNSNAPFIDSYVQSNAQIFKQLKVVTPEVMEMIKI